MTRQERSRCTRWRLGWMPGGKPRACPHCQIGFTSRRHFLSCLNTHRRLNLPSTVPDPVSHLLNLLPQQPPRQQTRQAFWSRCWPVLQQILPEIDKACHPDDQSWNAMMNATFPKRRTSCDGLLTSLTRLFLHFRFSSRRLTLLFPFVHCPSPVVSTDLFSHFTFQVFFLLLIHPIL